MNNLSTNGSEFLLPNGRPYRGRYHIHVSQGAMVGATHTSVPHARLRPVNRTVAERVASIQRQLRGQQASANKIQSTRATNRRLTRRAPQRRPSTGRSSGSSGY